MNVPPINIWEEILAGDPAAWEQLVLAYSRLVYAVAHRTGLSSSEADDCVQQTWLSLYRARTRIKDPDRIAAWLTRTARHKALKMLRHKEVVERHRDQIDQSSPPEQPDQEILLAQQQAQLRLALSRLDDRCRRLLEAVFFSPDPRSYKEIADQLGLPINSFGPTRSRCLDKLRKILEEIGFA